MPSIFPDYRFQPGWDPEYIKKILSQGYLYENLDLDSVLYYLTIETGTTYSYDLVLRSKNVGDVILDQFSEAYEASKLPIGGGSKAGIGSSMARHFGRKKQLSKVLDNEVKPTLYKIPDAKGDIAYLYFKTICNTASGTLSIQDQNSRPELDVHVIGKKIFYLRVKVPYKRVDLGEHTDDYAMILSTVDPWSFIYLVNLMGIVQFDDESKKAVKIVFHHLFKDAGTDRDKLDRIYYWAPQFILVERDSILLWRDLGIIMTGSVDSYGTDEERAVLNILRALSSPEKFNSTFNYQDQIQNYIKGTGTPIGEVQGEITLGNPRADEYLLALLKLKVDEQPLFQLLYDKLHDFGGEDNFTEFILQIYAVWVQSNFFLGESVVLPYESEKTLGFFDTTHDFEFTDNYEKILISKDRVNGFWQLIVESNPIGALTNSEYVGAVSIYERISLVNTSKIDFVSSDKLMAIPEIVPAFFIKGLDDKANSSNLETGIYLAVDILTTFTGIGNFAKFARLGKILFAAQKGVKATEKLYVVIKIGISGLEIISGVLGAMLTMASDCDSRFCQKLRTFLFWMDMVTLSADALTTRFLKKSAKDVFDLVPTSSRPKSVTQEMWDGIKSTIRHAAGEVGDWVFLYSAAAIYKLLREARIKSRQLKLLITSLQQLGVKMFKNDKLATSVALPGGTMYRLEYKGTEIFRGTRERLNSFAEKLNDIREAEGLRRLGRHLDELTESGAQKAKRQWEEFDYNSFDLTSFPSRKPCFLAGTLVSTEDGHIPIEEVKNGHVVKTFNFKTNEIEYKPVTDTFKNVTRKYVNIGLENGEVISSTGNHWFWLPEKGEWLPASQLNEGDSLLDKDLIQVPINDIKVIALEQKTFNLEVKDNPNYFVGDQGVLVHNNSGRRTSFASILEKDHYFYNILNANRDVIYVGLTTTTINNRFKEHQYEYEVKSSKGNTRKNWMKEAVISIDGKVNGKKGPFKMTKFEAAVVEYFEIQQNGGIKRYGGKLYNKVRPISKRKFNLVKQIGWFNPCKFYV